MIKIITVKNSKQVKDFVMFPFKLYKDCEYWVPPIINEEIEAMDTSKNPVFKNAEAEFYLAYDEQDNIVGRIAAIVNWVEIKDQKKNKLRFGWYDTIDNLEVSKKLIEKALEFGKERKLEFIEGPVGFSNMDKAGLLTYGYDELNTMITWYHYPYQKEHLIKLGLKQLAEWVEYKIKIFSEDEAPEKVKKFAEIIAKRYNLKSINFKSTKQIIPYVDKMFELLNITYSPLQTYVTIKQYQIDFYKEKFIKYIHPDFIKCVVDSEGNLIAFLITMPSFSRALKKVNGKLFPFGFLHILKAQHFNNRVSLYLIGVDPKYQSKGATAILFNDLQQTFNKRGIVEVETNPELVENKAIQAFWKNYESTLHKRRATFTKKI
jgi:ribosomal protein S18 acetylase RimI-like enzyme|tara:strand:+ start:2926 stop:4053 length:1128 start_codon:yes stop_codon:yes gene_type:complete